MGTFRTFAETRATIAKALEHGELGATYADGAVILCSAIAAMAAWIWPKHDKNERIDKKRFIELLIKFTPPSLGAGRISRVMLIADPKLLSIRSTIAQRFGLDDTARCLFGGDDPSENQILTSTEQQKLGILKQDLRKYSHAALLYEEMRCSFVHDYGPGPRARELNPHSGLTGTNSLLDADVAYVNMLDHDPNDPAQGRRIYFPLRWVGQLAIAAGNALDKISEEHGAFCKGLTSQERPKRWWLDGG